jgi:hypothetical protein
VSTEGRSGLGGLADGQDEHSWIVLPPETGEQPSLSSGLKVTRPGLTSILLYSRALCVCDCFSVVQYAPASLYTYSSPHRFEHTPIEATPLSATSAVLGSGLGMGLGLGSHFSSAPILSHTILFPRVHQCVGVRLVHASRGSPYPKAHVLYYAPPTPAHSFVMGAPESGRAFITLRALIYSAPSTRCRVGRESFPPPPTLTLSPAPLSPPSTCAPPPAPLSTPPPW